MAVSTYAVVGAVDNDVDFSEQPEEFRAYVLRSLLAEQQHLSLLVRLVGDELAARRNQSEVATKKFFVVEVHLGHGPFALMAQEGDTNDVVRIEVGDIIRYVHVSD